MPNGTSSTAFLTRFEFELERQRINDLRTADGVAVQAALNAAEKAVTAALTAAEKADTRARELREDRDRTQNEWRGTISDLIAGQEKALAIVTEKLITREQAKTLLDASDIKAAALKQALEARLVTLENRGIAITATEDQKALTYGQVSRLVAVSSGIIGSLLALATFIATH